MEFYPRLSLYSARGDPCRVQCCGQRAKALAIFGPCVGDGIETVDVFDEAPRKTLRG